ncbi:hypothetical protein HQ590_07765, partial [bacterium]|nr:hypothetical protein [bacterium]
YWTPDSFLEGLRSAGFEIGHIQTGPVAPDAANLPFLAGNLYVDVRKPG